jgi:hypothetical protein
METGLKIDMTGIDEILTVGKKAFSGVNALIDTYNNWKRSKISKESKLALLLMECRRNLTLLETVKLNEKGDQTSKYLCQIAESLEISVLSNFFMDAFNGDNSLLKSINELEIIVDNKNEQEKIEKRKAIDVVCFIYQRTIIVKSIADLGVEFQNHHGIHFKTRLKNLENNIHILSAALASSKSKVGNWNFN